MFVRLEVKVSELADGRWIARVEDYKLVPWQYRGWKFIKPTRDEVLEGFERSLRRYHAKLLKVHYDDWLA